MSRETMTEREPGRRWTMILVAFALLAGSPAWAADGKRSESARSEIESANRTFEAAFARGDAAGIAAFYTDTAQVMPAGSDFVTGTQAIAEFWQGAFDAGMKSVSLVTKEVEKHGDTAYEVGELEIRDAGGAVMDRAKYVVIWKKERGSWKLHRDIWTTSIVADQE
jgi:ketosteroid isomerase-like protein